MRILLLIACLQFIGECPAESPTFVSVREQEILSADGSPLELRGVNLGNWLLPEGYFFSFYGRAQSPRALESLFAELVGPVRAETFWTRYLESYVTRDDLAYLKSIGINHVRLPINYRMFTGEEYLGRVNHGFSYIDRVLEWAKDLGLLVLLDLHAAPGGQNGTNIDDSFGYPFLLVDEAAKQQTIALWRTIAARYRDNATVLGYDLLNEPIAHYFLGDLNKLRSELEPLYRRITAAIREVDKQHLIFLEGALWAYDFTVFGRPFDPKLVYEFHRYSMETKISKETGMPIPQFGEYLSFSQEHKVPLYLGEFGEDEPAWVKSWREKVEAQKIGWCFWSYKKMMSDLRGIRIFEAPAKYEKVVEFAETDRSTAVRIIAARPDFATSQRILDDLVENSKFKNTKENSAMIEALGLGKR